MGNQGTTVVIRIAGCDNINVISCCCTNVLTPSVIFNDRDDRKGRPYACECFFRFPDSTFCAKNRPDQLDPGEIDYLMTVTSVPTTAVKASTIWSQVTPYSGFSMTKKARSPQTTACFSVASTQTHLRVSMLSNMV